MPSIIFADGFTLYESRVICKYLARKYSFPLLLPESDVEATALFEQAQCVEMLYFAEPAGQIAFEKVAKRFMGLPADEAVVAKALRMVEAFFDVLDDFLERREYVAGDGFTLVDVFYVPLVQRLFLCGYEEVVESRPAVSAWWERCVSRPAVQMVAAANKEAAGGK